MNQRQENFEIDEAVRVGTCSGTSGVTRFENKSKDFAKQEQISLSNLQKSEWTNEKHTLFLNSIEASFVEQMQNQESHMTTLRSWLVRNQRQLRTYSKSSVDNLELSSDQFKVLRKGSWEKINFAKAQISSDLGNEPRLLSNPWIQHFRPASTGKGLLDAHLSNPFENHVLPCEANLSRRNYLESSDHPLAHCPLPYCEDFIGDNTEVSDQNFVDEDCQGSEQLSIPSKRKRENSSGAEALSRKKSSTTISSKHDQFHCEKDEDCRSSFPGKVVKYSYS